MPFIFQSSPAFYFWKYGQPEESENNIPTFVISLKGITKNHCKRTCGAV
jgi:hypothetical protein